MDFTAKVSETVTLRGQAYPTQVPHEGELRQFRWNLGICGDEGCPLPIRAKVQLMFPAAPDVVYRPCDAVIECLQHSRVSASRTERFVSSLSKLSESAATFGNIGSPAAKIASAGVAILPALAAFVPKRDHWRVVLFNCRSIYKDSESDWATGIEWNINWEDLHELGNYLMGAANVSVAAPGHHMDAPHAHFRVGVRFKNEKYNFYPELRQNACRIPLSCNLRTVP